MKTIKPARNQVFARPEKEERQTEAGIWLSNQDKIAPQKAEVINVGSGVTWLKPKDAIVYKKYTATDIQLNKEDFILLDEEDILGVVLDADEQ